MRTEVYSWRLSSDLKSDLEREARLRKFSVCSVLDYGGARVNIDYHIAFDSNFYSVPYKLVHELVEVRSTPATIEIFHKGQRAASRLRARSRARHHYC